MIESVIVVTMQKNVLVVHSAKEGNMEECLIQVAKLASVHSLGTIVEGLRNFPKSDQAYSMYSTTPL